MDLVMYLFKLEIGKSLSVCQKNQKSRKILSNSGQPSKFGVDCLLRTFYKNTHWYNHKKTDQYEIVCVEDKITEKIQDKV